MKTLSVTLTDELYYDIKHTVPSRQVSKFVSDAVKVKLKEQTDELYNAYLSASQDTEIEKLSQEWDAIEIEDWE